MRYFYNFRVVLTFQLMAIAFWSLFQSESAMAATVANVTISTSATSGGTWSAGPPWVFTPNAGVTSANILNTELQTKLGVAEAGYHVTINTTNASGNSAGNGDIIVNAPIVLPPVDTRSSAYTFRLNAARNIAINAAINVSGTSSYCCGIGAGDNLFLSAPSGSVVVSAPLTAQGGANTGGGGSIGYNGGNVTILAGTTVLISAAIVTTGGTAAKGAGGSAGSISITAPEGLTLNANLTANGGAGTTGSQGGPGGNGGTITINDGATIVTTGAGTGTNDGQISGIIAALGATGTTVGAGGSLIKTGNGTFVLSQLNTYRGTTTVSAGILRASGYNVTASANGPFGNNASGLYLNGGTIQSDVATFSRPLTVTYTGSGLDAYGAARTISAAINNATTSSTFNLNVGGTTASGADGQQLTLSGVISNTAGSLSLTKIGTSTVTLSAANTFSGGTRLNAGQLNINHATATGSGTLTLVGGILDNTTAGTITLSNNNAQNWNGDFTFAGTQPLNLGTGAITLNGNRQVTVGANTLTAGGIINQGSFGLTKAGNGTLAFGNQIITLHHLTISAGTLISTSGNLNLAGNFSNDATFSHNNGTVTFNGTTAQTTGGATFHNLVLNNAAGVNLTANVTYNARLTLSSGVIATGAYTLTGNSGSTVSRTSGHVSGNFRKYIALGGTSATFEAGDADSYTPVAVAFASVTTAGHLTVSTTSGDHPQISTSTIYDGKSINRYWTLTNSGILFTYYSVTFTFAPGDADPGTATGNLIVGRQNAGWTYPSVGTKTSTTTQATGLTAFGDFQLGEIYGVKTFTGTGNFSDAARWSGGTLPAAAENIVIDGTCTIDNHVATDNIAYGTLTIGTSTGRSLSWAAGGTNRLNVSTVKAGSGASSINMTNGGTLIVRETWSTTNLSFTPGTGTVEIQSAVTLPAAYTTYHHLTINGSGKTVSLGAATSVTGNLTIAEGTLNANNFNLAIGGNWTNNASPGAFTSGSASVNFNGAASQTIGGTSATTFNNLTIANTLSLVNLNNDIAIGGNLTITGTLDLAGFTANRSSEGGTLTVSDNATLKIGGTNTYPANYTTNAFSATSTIDYSGTTQVVKGITYSNLTISGSGSKTTDGDITVNGILNLNSDNASATLGCLDMSPYLLHMGAVATTIGRGDVTGIVKRTQFTAGVPYTFGNQYTTITFNAGGTYPSQIQLKIRIGTAPSWKSDAVKRLYDLLQADANNCYATVTYHYLDSELNGNNEDKLVHIINGTPGPPLGVVIVGSSNHNSTENWVAVSNAALQYLGTSFDVLQNSLIESDLPTYTWNGSNSSSWTEIGNWTPLGIPVSTSNVVIPDASTTTNDPTLPSDTEISTLKIEAGGILNALSNEQLTIHGDNGAWSNIGGTFNPASSNVTFTNAAATMSGTTNFHDVTIAGGAALTPGEGNTMRIAGAITNNGTLRAAELSNTIEYNGSDQTVIHPNGMVSGYSNLILSGSGTKTMPGSAMSIAGTFTLSGSALATAVAALSVGGNTVIGSGTTLNLGTYGHSLAGNLTNNGGTFSSSGSITFNGTTQQTITSSSGIAFHHFSITNTSAPVTLGASTNCNLTGDLGIDSGAVFDLAANSLTAVTGSVSNSGTIRTRSTSATPLPSGKTWGGSVEYTANDGQTMVSGTYNNLVMTGSGGATADGGITVNGILNLASMNPSSTKGILDMGNYTLLMGSAATTIGEGDVTGIVKRTTITANTTYSFGHRNTTIFFPNVGTLPSEISVKIRIGAAPSWKPGAVQRIYDLIQTGGSGTQALLHAHYLDSELNGNREELLVDWLYIFAASLKIEYGRSGYDMDENYVAISNSNFAFYSSTFGAKEVTMDESELVALTWNGSESSSWVTANNWTPNGAPSDHTAITIPDAATTNFDLAIPNTATCGSIKLENGAVLNANGGAQLTINGGEDAWNNQGGTFNPGTSTLVFKNSNARMSGSTDFYNVTIDNGASLTLEDNTYMGLSGTFTNNGTFITSDSAATTVEYKGADQTVVVPADDRYSSLILSGSGTKTMPAPALTIEEDFSLSGTVSATANSALTIQGNVTIGNGSTWFTGENNHFIGGNFTNNGTFTPATGYYVTMNGDSAQTMDGTSATTFDNLTISNPHGVDLHTSENINNVLTLDGGNLRVGTTTLGINGTIVQTSGNSKIEVGSGSSFSFGGTEALVIPDNIFTTAPSINHLTVNRSGGVTLGNQDMTVNGLLNLLSGTFGLGANSLTIAGSSPTRTSGMVDAGNAGSTIAFTNTSAVTLPDSLFAGPVNNLTINGSGGVTSSGNFTINGLLNLQSANPSDTKGSLDMWDGSEVKTLTMGASATTLGPGDVTGIVRRTTILAGITYTFGNQHTTAYFLAEGTLPSEMSVRIKIGNPPSWRPGGINRETELIQTGGSNTKAIFKMHYLDSELNGNDEDHLVLWVGLPTPIEYGRSAFNTTENWVKMSNVNLAFFSSTWDGTKEITLDEAGTTTTLTWNGSLSDSWTSVENWTPNEGPSDIKKIIIPDASTTLHDPTLPITTEIKSINIASGGILNSSSNAQLTINGGNDAWNNVSGTFNPNTSNIIFTNAEATISGITNFYDVTIDSLATLTVTGGNIMRIAGTMTNNGTWYTTIGDATTVEYNGADQAIAVTNPAANRYSHLILSGSGTKTMPVTAMEVVGNLSVTDTARVTANGALTVQGDLSIENGSQLSISPAGNLSVSGTITNQAGAPGFVLQSDTTGTASLIHQTNDVPATVKRSIPGEAEAWHFISSPVSAQGIGGSWLPAGTYGNGTGYDLYIWNEPTNCWIYHLNTTAAVNWNTVHPGSDFMVGRGYLYSEQATHPTKEFIGNLNNGSVSYALTSGSSDESLKGFNLVGNPYPSSIDWQAISGWNRSNLVNSGEGYDMWIWNPEANNYGVFNSFTGIGTNAINRFIAPMQGYFVQASSDGNLEMNNGVRVHEGAGGFKSAKINPAMLSLMVKSESGKGFDEVQLLFGYGSNQGGAAKLFGNVATAPGLFVPYGNQYYSVRYLTDTIDHPTLPVMFKPGSDGYYTLSGSFDTDKFEIVMLEDRLMHSIQNMKSEKTYRFKASQKDDNNRFVLHFTAKNKEAEKDLPARVYPDGIQLVVDLTLVSKETDVFVYDLMGRKIMQQKLQGEIRHTLNLHAQTQVLIVHLKNRDGSFVQKFVWAGN